MNERAKSVLESMSEADIIELMMAVEDHAERLGFRNFAKSGSEFSITPETEKIIESKADDNDVVKNDGSVGLTADWITPYKITAEQIASSIAVGTSPFEVVSTTCVTNLNADTIDGAHASALAVDATVLKKDGSVALTADWDIGNGRMILADKIRARDGDGLALYDDAGLGIVITDGGSVGIGASVPQRKLHLYGDVEGYTPVFGATIQNINNTLGYAEMQLLSDISDMRFGTGGTGTTPYGGSAGSGYLGMVSNYGLIIATNNTVRVYIKNSGEIGIGTMSPTSKLQVVGLPIYANNAGAVAGGLTAGAFYRTNGDPDLVCVVH